MAKVFCPRCDGAGLTIEADGLLRCDRTVSTILTNQTKQQREDGQFFGVGPCGYRGYEAKVVIGEDDPLSAHLALQVGAITNFSIDGQDLEDYTGTIVEDDAYETPGSAGWIMRPENRPPGYRPSDSIAPVTVLATLGGPFQDVRSAEDAYAEELAVVLYALSHGFEPGTLEAEDRDEAIRLLGHEVKAGLDHVWKQGAAAGVTDLDGCHGCMTSNGSASGEHYVADNLTSPYETEAPDAP